MRMSTIGKLDLKGQALTLALDLALALYRSRSDTDFGGGSGAGSGFGFGTGSGADRNKEVQWRITMVKPATRPRYELGPCRHSKFNMNERHENENEMTTISKFE